MKIAISLLIAVGLFGQTIKLPARLEALSRIADETVDVTLDGAMLRFAERFLSDNDPEQAKVKRIIRGLNAIYIRTYEFSKENSYSPADVDEIRAQFKGPEWSRVVETKEGDRSTSEIYMKMKGSEMAGLLVVAAEARELTIVHLDGIIKPEEVATLSGHIGLPRFVWGCRRCR